MTLKLIFASISEFTSKLMKKSVLIEFKFGFGFSVILKDGHKIGNMNTSIYLEHVEMFDFYNLEIICLIDILIF